MRTLQRHWAASALLLLLGCRTADNSAAVFTPAPARPTIALSTGDRASPGGRAAPASWIAATIGDRGGAKSERPSDPPDIEQVELNQESVAANAAAPVGLTLDGAIATSLERNPTVIALRAGEPVAQAAYGVAEVYPWNPFVQVQVLPYARDTEGRELATNHYVWLMQTLELAHQGRYRRASAAAACNQVRWNIVQGELTNAAQTERLYFTALYQRDLRDLAQRTAALNADLLGVVERRFGAGIATVAEQTTARVTARQGRKQAALAETAYQAALLALRRQLNLPTAEPFALVGRLEEFDWLPIAGIDEAQGQAIGAITISEQVAQEMALQRPDVMAAHAAVNVAQSNADLARANLVQNVGIGPFYERDESGTVFAGFRTQMTLPVWDSGRPLLRQREAETQQQIMTLSQLQARAQIEVETALDRYERARRLAGRERTDFSRTIPAELRRVQEQFAAGQADILNVFAAQNSLLQEYRSYLDLLNELAQAAADVTLAAGLAPARVVRERAGEQVPPADAQP
jgi:outer membrane protein TolC